MSYLNYHRLRFADIGIFSEQISDIEKINILLSYHQFHNESDISITDYKKNKTYTV